MENIYDTDYYEGSDGARIGGYFSYSGMERATNKTDRFASAVIRRECGRHGGKLRLLDIGCGYGFFLKQFKDNPQIELMGIEPGKPAADKASQITDSIIRRRFEDVDFQNQPNFDFVTAFEVVEHLPDPVGFLAKVCRILKNGGYLFLSTPDIGSVWFKLLKKRWPGIHPDFHNVYFSKKTLTTMAGENGFETVMIRSRNYYYTSIRHVRKRLSELFPLIGKCLALLKPLDAATVPFLNGGDLQVILRKKNTSTS